MQVGIFLTNQNPVGSDMIPKLDEQLAMTRLARDRGWDIVASGQHYLSEGASQLQLVPFLARLAAEAGHMTGVAGILLLGLHNPVEVAETMASLDIIWGGRFVFGIGLGYRDVEFDAFKVPRGQRVRRFESCLEVVKRLWTEDRVTVDNDVCTLKDVSLTCRPVQRPHPPVWVAANNDKAIARAARIGDTWFINPHATMTTIVRQMGVYRDELARVGKPFPRTLPIFKEIFCAKDRATALATAGPYLAGKYKTYAAWGQDAVMPAGETFQQPFESLLEDRFVLGSPEECYEQLRPCWETVGATALVLRTQWIGMPGAHALDSMRLISDELLPALHQVKTAS
ncbi:MAG TPA: LLM class flavin-dependent oxidoreductase [Gemmatimonadales bacterium]|nr:LLM class flavin-dependent oxidoreductase [Candidatus Bathyarchaeia archaeon]HVO35280.1 LLM class flavin-dependent oxidoreductase [Gemmatimonadales bacterium]